MTELIHSKERPDRWLDTWLDQAAASTDAKVRANTAIALITLGGRRRMAQLARLVGQAALELARGERQAEVVISAARNEIECSEFNTEARSLLAAVLADPSERISSRERMAARAILLGRGGFGEWLAMRRLTPFPVVIDIIALLIRAALLISVLFAVFVLSNYYISFDYIPPRDQIYQTATGLLIIAGVALISSITSAFLLVPGLSRVPALLLDGFIAACAVAAINPILLYWIPMGTPSWLWRDLLDYSDRSMVSGAWFWFLAFSIPGCTVVRVLTATAKARKRPVYTGVFSAGWPILIVTCFALAVQWLAPDHARSVSFSWLLFVINAVLFGIAAAKVDSDWVIPTIPMEGQAVIARFADSGMWAYMLSVAMLMLCTIWASNLYPSIKHEFSIAPDEEFHQMWDVPVNTRFRVLAPIESRIQFSTPDEAWVISARNGSQTIDNFRDITENSRRIPGLRLKTVSGMLELCIADVLSYDESGKRCGIQAIRLDEWLPVVITRSTATSTLSSADMIELFVTRLVKPAPVVLVGIPDHVIRSFRNKPREEHKVMEHKITLQPTSGGRVYELDIPIPNLFLSAKMSKEDDIHDKMLIIERVEEDVPRLVRTGDDPDTIDMSYPLVPGKYRICARMFNAMFRDCNGPSYEILSDPIEVTLTLQTF